MINFECIRVFVFLCCISFLFVSVSANASSVRQLEVSEMLEIAEFVFEGDVIASYVRWNSDKTLIMTYITFAISDVILGDYQKDMIELSFVGGVIGGQGMKAEGLRQPKVGEKGIYFIESISRQLVNPLVGWSQGHFLIKEDQLGNENVMTDQSERVIAISNEPRLSRTAMLSDGVARGIIVSTDELSTGMKVAEFKQQLRQKAPKKAISKVR